MILTVHVDHAPNGRAPRVYIQEFRYLGGRRYRGGHVINLCDHKTTNTFSCRQCPTSTRTRRSVHGCGCATPPGMAYVTVCDDDDVGIALYTSNHTHSRPRDDTTVCTNQFIATASFSRTPRCYLHEQLVEQLTPR